MRIEKALRCGVPICIATQFLEELAQNGRICAPELNDVFLARCQKADMLMLAGEVGGSPNSKKCIDFISRMIQQNNMEYGGQEMKKNKCFIGCSELY